MPDLGTSAAVIVALAAVVTIVLAWWWRRQDARQKILDAARAAAANSAERWRVSILSTAHAYEDPDLRQVLDRARKWRAEAASDLVQIKKACRTGASYPFRTIERALGTLAEFQTVVEPLAAKYQPDMTKLYEDDPAWKE